jgi:multiple sugar transport system substrate-binding protein
VVESPVVEPSQVGAAGGGPQLNPNVSGNIDFWHFWSSPQRRTAIKRVIALCQKELPNIKVNDTPKPFSDIYTANTAAVAAGSGMPDVIVEDRPKLPNAAANNIEQSLQQYAQRDGIDGSQFWPFTWQQTLYKDEPYGIPFETDVRVLYWNKNAFEEAGLDPNKPPKTWAELEEYANKLDKKNPDGSYARIGFSPLIGNIGPEIWGYTNDVQWVTEDGKPSINDPKAVETVEWIKKWIDRYGGWQNHQNFKAGFAAPPNDAFMSGKVAMYVDINGYASTLNFFRPRTKNAEGKDVDLQWGVSDLPYKTDKASWSGGFALSIPRGADGADAAWEFIKCATGPEAQASWARDTYAMPANQAAAKDPTLLADPNWQMFVDAMSYTTGGNYLPQYPNWGQELGNRYEKVWTGELSPQDALQQAQQAVEAKVKGQ